jgi:hypothetical protein
MRCKSSVIPEECQNSKALASIERVGYHHEHGSNKADVPADSVRIGQTDAGRCRQPEEASGNSICETSDMKRNYTLGGDRGIGQSR